MLSARAVFQRCVAAQEWSMACMYPVIFMQSPIEGLLGRLHILSTANNAAVKLMAYARVFREGADVL